MAPSHHNSLWSEHEIFKLKEKRLYVSSGHLRSFWPKVKLFERSMNISNWPKKKIFERSRMSFRASGCSILLLLKVQTFERSRRGYLIPLATRVPWGLKSKYLRGYSEIMCFLWLTQFIVS